MSSAKRNTDSLTVKSLSLRSPWAYCSRIGSIFNAPSPITNWPFDWASTTLRSSATICS